MKWYIAILTAIFLALVPFYALVFALSQWPRLTWSLWKNVIRRYEVEILGLKTGNVVRFKKGKK